MERTERILKWCKEHVPLMEAYLQGKKVQYKVNDSWSDLVHEPGWNRSDTYRLKPEIYRACASFEEARVFVNTRIITNNHTFEIVGMTNTHFMVTYTTGCYPPWAIPFQSMFNGYTTEDGSRIGVLVN